MLELRHIDKTYLQGKMEVPVLRDVSLCVEEGEYLAIMGPSGSGKTTLMNIIGCLDVPTSGEYLLEGKPLSGSSDAMLSQTRLNSIGFVFQSFYLLPRQSALENVALPLLYAGVGKKQRLAQAKTALERVGLGDRLDFKPTQLSGGQCQRVAIARAMVNSPKILLADEPTGALDTASGEQVMEIFEKLNREGVTIVMITHEPSIAAQAHRILHIRDGRLVDPPASAVPKPVSVPSVVFTPVQPQATAASAEEAPAEPTEAEIAAFVTGEAPSAPAAEPTNEPESEPEPPAPPQEPEAEPVAAPKAAPAPAPTLAAPVAVRRQGHDALKPLPAPASSMPATDQPLAAPVAVRRQETSPVSASRVEEPVVEIEDIPVETPEDPAEFARALHSMAAAPVVLPKVEAPAAPAAPLPLPERPAPAEEALEEELGSLLDEEVSALIHRGEETAGAYASGEMFLRDATAKPSMLITKATKAGAPDQVTFDVWKKPEELDVEAIAAQILPLETAREPEPVPAEETPAAPPVSEAAPEPAPAPRQEDVLFDQVQADIEAGFDRGALPPKSIELDLNAAFAPKAAPLPWGKPAVQDRDRLVEIPDLLGKAPSTGGDSP